MLQSKFGNCKTIPKGMTDAYFDSVFEKSILESPGMSTCSLLMLLLPNSRDGFYFIGQT